MVEVSSAPTAISLVDPSETTRRDDAYVWHPWSPIVDHDQRIVLARGDNYRVWDTSGAEYIDASSLNLTCGYANRQVVDAVSAQMNVLQGVDISVQTHELVGRLAERLASYLPENLNKTLFVNSGSEGVEAAVLIANTYWRQLGEPKPTLLAFKQGYHGSTALTRSISGLPRVQHDFRTPFTVRQIDLPCDTRALRTPAGLSALVARFRSALESETIGAVVVEPFLNVGGGIAFAEGFLAELRALCDEFDALLILDEVFTGFGRTGSMFACTGRGVVPDILVSSKGLAGGYMPIAAVTVTDEVFETFKSEPVIGGLRYGHTTSGHAGACAAALATLQVLDEQHLCANAEAMGKRLLDLLERIPHTRRYVDLRREGLIVVLEFDSFETSSEVKAAARHRGLLLRQPGAALMAVPPLTIDSGGIDALAERLTKSLVDVGIVHDY